MFHPQTLLRSAGVRFGLIYAGLFALSAVALTAFLWWSTAGLLDRQTEAAINADAQGLVERFLDGPNALVETIQDRLAANVDDDAIYLLADPTPAADRRQSGGLAEMVTEPREWTKSRSTAPACSGLARIRHFVLPGGFHLLVGRDVQARAQLRASWVMR